MSAINLPNEAATHAFGRALALFLRADDVLLLDGALGAGKTTLSQAILAALCPEATHVTSPTFTLMQRYDVQFANGTAGECVHADLYRLSHPDELHEIGLDDAYGNSLCIIEWPSRMGSALPENYIYCGIETNNACQGRQVTLRMVGAKPHAELQAWFNRYKAD